MENFNNPNPFACDAPQQRYAPRDPEGNNTDSYDHALSPTATARVRSRSTDSRSSGKPSPSKLAPSSDSITAHPHRDRFKTAVDDLQTGVFDRVKTFGHRLHLDGVHAHGVTNILNPTTIRMDVRYQSDSNSDEDGQVHESQEASLLWRARDNRKGRNSIAVPTLPVDDGNDGSIFPARYTPRMSSKLSDIAHNLYKMATTFPYWDMSFWSGSSYTIGSALFIVDGVLAWGPVAFGEKWVSASAQKYGGPLSFFIGALFYQVGAVAAYLEAVNDGSFHGSAMRRFLDGDEDGSKKLLDHKIHDFLRRVKPHRPHQNPDTKMPEVDPEAGWKTKEERLLRPGSIYPEGKLPAPRRGGVDLGGDQTTPTSTYNTWRWWPTWRALREHHVYEIGWLACSIQLLGVTLYGVTAIVILPGILSSLQPWQELAAYWIPQVIAALCFLIASLMFMFETQEKWWKPEPTVLGWWIGVWSTVGSIGFELIACFGIKALASRGNGSGDEGHWAEYQSDLATIWGSSCYLIGSFLQWYEALNKKPVEELFLEPGEMKSCRIHPI